MTVQNGLEKAEKYLVAGVDSPVRAMIRTKQGVLSIHRGRGCQIYDQNKRRYIDYLCGWGSMIIGHAAPQVRRAIAQQVQQGVYFGTTHSAEGELAQRLVDALACAQKVRFVNSGTEAVMGAIRLTRGYTGRDLIVRFRGSYHGHADYLLTQAGSGLATLGITESLGVPKAIARTTVTLTYGDERHLKKVFQRFASRIAGVIVEPVGGNCGVVPPRMDFLQQLRRETSRHGALLIADEVITGFRFCYGSYLESVGIRPDLICLGKIIGGGLPVGAYAGPARLMDHLAPSGKVYQASTFSGHPVVMSAGAAVLDALQQRRADYRQLPQLVERLQEGIAPACQHVGLKMTRFGPMFCFSAEDQGAFALFYQKMLGRGIFFAPSTFESNFVGFAHSEKDIGKTIHAVRKGLG